MKRRFCIITLITAFYSCSGSGNNSGNGNNETTTPESFTLNGVTWATRNIASSGTFAEVPESFGGYFTFDEALSVCPSGWRLPVKPELDVLAGVESKWVALNGVFGREFGSGENTLFIPAAGYRRDGIIRTIGSSGEYRSSRQFMYGGDLGGYLFKINSNEVKVTVNNLDEVGYSVHCVEN